MENNYYEHCIKLLLERGVTIDDIVICSKHLQAKYNNGLTDEDYYNAVQRVLNKREVQFTIMTGVALDKLADQHVIPDEELQGCILNDEPLYGIDEVLAYSICNLYGSIALTNFGYIDREKFGIIAELNDDHSQCNTFIDDIIGAIAAAAAGNIAHNKGTVKDDKCRK